MTKNIPIKIEKINASIFQLTKISSIDIAQISEKFSYLPQGYMYQPKYRLLGKKGVTIKLVQTNGTFPAGLFSDVVNYIVNILKKEVVMSHDVMEHFLPFTDLFKESINENILADFEFDGTPVILRDYQLDALQSAFENRNCLLNLSTGSGKCLGGNTKLKIRIDATIAEKYKDLID